MTMHWAADILRSHSEVAFFLTLGIGYLIGRLRIGGFRLGDVTGVLVAGIIIGQLGVHVSDNVEAIFFLLFLFAVGYNVGPQFFTGLRKEGLPQLVLAVFVCVCCLVTAWLTSLLFNLGLGYGPGLFGGASTMTSAYGVSDGALQRLALTPDKLDILQSHMSVAFSITYIIGTAGSIWFLAAVGPKLLRVDLPAACKDLEKSMGAPEQPPYIHPVYHEFIGRTYRLDQMPWAGKTIAEFEKSFPGQRIFIERIRRGQSLQDVEPQTILQQGDIIAVASRHEHLVEDHHLIGTEVHDRELLEFAAEVLDIVITSPQFAGKTLGELMISETAGLTRGIFLRKITRGNQDIPITRDTVLHRGDILSVAGAARHVEQIAQSAGYADRPSDSSDVAMMGIAIFIGGFIGALTLSLGHIPLSLSTSGGVLLAGLVLGWLRSVHPTFAKVPKPALWVLSNLGLTAFVAVLGLDAGPGFLKGMREAGLELVLAGAIVSTVPLILGIYFGKYVLRMHPALILGGCAGARGATAALSEIQAAARSKTPALGYTVPYAVGNILLTLGGILIVMLLRR